MEQDKMRDEALEKIAEKWRDAAALGCVDALECALREAWQASREAEVREEIKALISPQETLRDKFAAKAMQPLLSAASGMSFGPEDGNSNARLAICAYAVADAMLAERNK